MAYTIVFQNQSMVQKEDIAYKLLAAQSVDETTSDAIDISGARAVNLVVVSGAGVSNGVVKIEVAMDSAGPFYVAGTVTTNAASSAFSDALGPGDNGFPALWARARIETVITGGTVDAYIVVQK